MGTVRKVTWKTMRNMPVHSVSMPLCTFPLCTPYYLDSLHSFFEMQLQSHFLQEALLN